MADNNNVKITGKGNHNIIIVVILLLALIGGCAVFFWLSGNDSAVLKNSVLKSTGLESSGFENERTTQVIDKTTNATAYYVAMPNPFVFNIMGLERERLVQVKVQLMVRGSHNEKLAKANMPLIESTLWQVFSATTEQQFATYEGKELLRANLLTSVNKILIKHAGKELVESVLFSGLVMQ